MVTMIFLDLHLKSSRQSKVDAGGNWEKQFPRLWAVYFP
jgi:hypothetical protein